MDGRLTQKALCRNNSRSRKQWGSGSLDPGPGPVRIPGGRWNLQSERFQRKAARWVQGNREIGIPDVPRTCLIPGHIGGILGAASQKFIDSGSGKRDARREGENALRVSISASRGQTHSTAQAALVNAARDEDPA